MANREINETGNGMGGIFKKGLDWAIIDVYVFSNKKIKKVMRKHGQIAGLIIICLWLFIYKNDYYISWDEDTQFDFADFIYFDFAVVNEIMQECLNVGLFNADLFAKYNILTSEKIQKRFFNATKRRDKVYVNTDYLLCEHDAYKNFIYVDNKGMNVNNERQSREEVKREENNKNDFFDSFKDFQNIYPGKKRSTETEFENFKNNIDNWKEIIRLLIPAIQKEETFRKKAKEEHRFFPDPKDLQTWINKRCWEQEFPKHENSKNNELVKKPKIISILMKRLNDVPIDKTIITLDNKEWIKINKSQLENKLEKCVAFIEDFEKHYNDFTIKEEND